MRPSVPAALTLLACFSTTAAVLAATADLPAGGKQYKDSRGRVIVFPMGAASFADEVVLYEKGNPEPDARWTDPGLVLGPPDYISDAADIKQPACLTLGGSGRLTLRFTDNYLVDIDGPDLYVFEVGPAVEATNLEISTDGKQWISVGKIAGATAAVDIHPFARPGEVYQYVRLTDLRSSTSGRWPGADIDAVGAIGAGVRMALKASTLFDFDKAEIKASARPELEKVAARLREYPSARVVIEGHTDNVGGAEYNQKLSERRAHAVRDYLASQAGMARRQLAVKGYGESRPLSSNDTESGREQNRRVEIVIVPAATPAGNPRE